MHQMLFGMSLSLLQVLQFTNKGMSDLLVSSSAAVLIVRA